MASDLPEDSPTDQILKTHRRSSSDSPSSQTSTSKLLQGYKSDPHLEPLCGRRVGTPNARHARGRRFDSPVLGLGGVPRKLVLRTSHQSPRNSGHQHYLDRRSSNEVFLPFNCSPHQRELRVSVTSISNGDLQNFPHHETSHASMGGSVSNFSRSSSHSEYTSVMREPQSTSEATTIPGRPISRSSTRRSLGREWTQHHWDKLKDLEDESDRARRCSKLSSGFAPLMIFGGLVFVCIGISANTNTGKDQERLKKLSTAPMVMGAFMLGLGLILVVTWFGCRAKARQLERKMLHGSRRGSAEENLVEAVLAKLYSQLGSAESNGNRSETPTLPGVTMDDVASHKGQSANESSSNSAHASTGASSSRDRHVALRETTV